MKVLCSRLANAIDCQDILPAGSKDCSSRLLVDPGCLLISRKEPSCTLCSHWRESRRVRSLVAGRAHRPGISVGGVSRWFLEKQSAGTRIHQMEAYIKTGVMPRSRQLLSSVMKGLAAAVAICACVPSQP